MNKVKAWIAAARLRTLPLSVSGIILGSALAEPLFYEKQLFWLAIITTIGFQVLSNFANDYGDGIKGTDDQRQGEKRMVASGMISPTQMRIGMIITAAITFLVATLLIYGAFGMEHLFMAFIFFNLALLAIIAAVKYTVGNKAYGYSGKGDLFVFLFFGLLSVLGSNFLFTKTFSWDLLLPAISIGTFSTAVLNLNNLRDYQHDEKAGKHTIVVKLGIKKAKIYHFLLLLLGMLTAIVYSFGHTESALQWLFLLAFIPLSINIKTVFRNKVPSSLDGELKKVALSTFFFAILMALFH
jgi:1,4-dihydroxy-2-naphthoate polyprenyltransferase